MSKDNTGKELYQAGISSENYTATLKTESYQEHPIATLDEPLVGWLVKPADTPMPEILVINGEAYQKIRITRYVE